jgi:hypothetical protein
MKLVVLEEIDKSEFEGGMYYEYRILVMYNFSNTIYDYRGVICGF